LLPACLLAVVSLGWFSAVGAADLARFELNDSSVIVGEPLSVTDGVYRIRMPALGDIEVPVSRVSSMVPADGAAAGIDPPADQPGKSR
jgi:hypothetical protein